MSTSKQIADRLEKNLKAFVKSQAKMLTDSISTKAQRNFRSFEKYASTDDPVVNVTVRNLETTDYKVVNEIVCGGSQVLFIEFGVGVMNMYRQEVEHTSDGTVINTKFGKRDNPLFSSFTFKTIGNRDAEIAPREVLGIKPLGGYGKGYGKDTLWVRPSSTGIPNLTAGETHVHSRNGEVRPNVIWTAGHPPARALYRAYLTTLRNYQKQWR